jgi:hypothetical protein
MRTNEGLQGMRWSQRRRCNLGGSRAHAQLATFKSVVGPALLTGSSVHVALGCSAGRVLCSLKVVAFSRNFPRLKLCQLRDPQRRSNSMAAATGHCHTFPICRCAQPGSSCSLSCCHKRLCDFMIMLI